MQQLLLDPNTSVSISMKIVKKALSEKSRAQQRRRLNFGRARLGRGFLLRREPVAISLNPRPGVNPRPGITSRSARVRKKINRSKSSKKTPAGQ